MTRTLEILERLVAFPSVSAASNLALIDYVSDLLANADFTLNRIPSACGEKAGLFAQIGSGDNGICLSAHTDVVPVEGQDWSVPPFALTKQGDRLLGRGTTDMKGFLASALAAAERAGTRHLSHPLSLSISYDEEIGCVGLQHMLPTLAPLVGRPRAVIVGEPTSMQIAIGHKGKSAFDVTCHGQAGHSALAPNFVNAIHVAAGFIAEIQTLQANLANGPRDKAYGIPYSTLHIGRIEGGRALNIVPDKVTLALEVRRLAEHKSADILEHINAAAAKACLPFGAQASITITEQNTYPPLRTNPDAPVVAWAGEILPKAKTTKVDFGTEAGFFSNLGHPTLVIGPGDMAQDGHKPNEGLALSQLQDCDAMLERVIGTLANA